MKLSIVIPAYNAGPTLERCLSSVIAQSISCQWEALVVDDGSQDSTAQFVRAFSRQHPQVRLISQKHAGVSSARNRGLAEATGTHIWFLDADDYAAPGGIGYVLRNFWTDGLDALRFASVTLDRQTLRRLVEPPRVTGQVTWQGTGRDYLKQHTPTFVCDHIYRKAALRGITFSEDKAIGEDVDFNLEFYMTNPRVRCVDACIYRYTVGPHTAVANRSLPAMRGAVRSYLNLFSKVNHYIDACPDAELRQGLESNYLGSQCIPFMSRFMCADADKQNYLRITAALKRLRVIPAKFAGPYSRVINSLLNVTGKGHLSYLKYKVASHLYRTIFVPYILPQLSRN